MTSSPTSILTSHLQRPAEPSALPRLLRGAFRCGMALVGLLWICCATVLCGCNSMNGYVMNESGKAYYRRGDYSLARHEFERALMDSPENPNYAYNVAAAMQQQGDVIAAERLYQQALVLEPSHQPAYEGLAHLLNSQGRTHEAEQLLTAWASTQPYVPESNLALARLQTNRGDVGAAEQSLQRALVANPRQRQVKNELGKLYRQTGRNREAADAYGQVLAANPYDVEAQMEMASMYQAQNQGTSPALLMANQMAQYDPTMRATGMGPGVLPTAPYNGAPGYTQNTAPSIYGNMYGTSAYGRINPPIAWGTPASVPLPQTMNEIAAQSQMQQQPMQQQMGWNLSMTPAPDTSMMMAAPAQQGMMSNQLPMQQPPMGWNHGMAATPDASMMAPQGQFQGSYQGPMTTSSPAMMQGPPAMVQGGPAPHWNPQGSMAMSPQMMNQATTVNYTPMSYSAAPQVVGAAGMAPMAQPPRQMPAAPATSQMMAVPAF